MLNKLRKKLGHLKRAAIGIYQNTIEPVPKVSNNLKSFTIGQTVSGKPIRCFEIGNGPTPLLFASAIHGNEVGTVKTAHSLINYLANNITRYPIFTFYIIPVLNIDGYEQALKNPDYLRGGRVGRFNKNEVDLNRNFPTKSFASHSIWNHGKNFEETTEVFCGNSLGSEPENQALRSLIKDKEIKLLIMLHNAGRSVMANKNEIAQRLTEEFAKASGYRKEEPHEWGELGQTGTAKEWCDENNIVYIEPEGAYRYGSDWANQKKGIEAVLLSL